MEWRIKNKGRGKEIAVTVLAALILSSIFFIHPYVVTGGSMEPTYHEGQVVLIETLMPHLFMWRGEVLVIRNPHDHSVIDIKRVVGLPNEHITLGENSVTATLNGHATTYGPPVGLPSTDFFDMQLGPADYMVLGDNRSHSTDSRDFGAVQQGDIIGHVILKI
jgi:signal peptidase I